MNKLQPCVSVYGRTLQEQINGAHCSACGGKLEIGDLVKKNWLEEWFHAYCGDRCPRDQSGFPL